MRWISLSLLKICWEILTSQNTDRLSWRFVFNNVDCWKSAFYLLPENQYIGNCLRGQEFTTHLTQISSWVLEEMAILDPWVEAHEQFTHLKPIRVERLTGQLSQLHTHPHSKCINSTIKERMWHFSVCLIFIFSCLLKWLMTIVEKFNSWKNYRKENQNISLYPLAIDHHYYFEGHLSRHLFDQRKCVILYIIIAAYKVKC